VEWEGRHRAVSPYPDLCHETNHRIANPSAGDGLQEEGLGLEPTVPRLRDVAFRAQLPGWVRAQRYRAKRYEGNRHRGGGSGFWVRTKQSDMAFEVPSRWFSAGKLKIC
jgi:hypothetical protein